MLTPQQSAILKQGNTNELVLRDMQISKSEKKNLGPHPLPNPGYAPSWHLKGKK